MEAEVRREDVLLRQSAAINAKIDGSVVAVLGCGGLGSNAANILARLGVTKLIIYDYDVVEPSNLNRQNYGIDDIGRPKVEVTKKRLESQLPAVKVSARHQLVTAEELAAVYEEADIFVEAFDSVEAKMLAYDFFAERQKPYICTTGVAGPYGEIGRKDFGNIHVVGDFQGEDRKDCYAPKVVAIAALECQIVLELLMK